MQTMNKVLDAIGVVCATILLAGLIYLAATYQPAPALPQCPEDATLVGQGDFEAGRYQWYECGPAFDDFEGYER